MSKNVNSFLNKMIKYDLYGGLILTLILSISVSSKFSIIYFVGVVVALVNFFVSGKIIKNRLSNKRGSMLFTISYVLRLLIVVVAAIPFISQLSNLIAYVMGYFSHFIFLAIYWIKSQKGSD